MCNVHHCIRPLETLGYEHRGEAGVPGRAVFHKSSDGRRTHHLYTIQAGDEEWHRHLFFQHYLPAHPEAASRYERLKYALAVHFRNDCNAHTDAGPASSRRPSARLNELIGSISCSSRNSGDVYADPRPINSLIESPACVFITVHSLELNTSETFSTCWWLTLSTLSGSTSSRAKYPPSTALRALQPCGPQHATRTRKPALPGHPHDLHLEPNLFHLSHHRLPFSMASPGRSSTCQVLAQAKQRPAESVEDYGKGA